MRPGKFHGKLVTESIADGWEKIIQPKGQKFYYVTSYGRRILPADGFVPDLGSVPRVFWTICPPHYLKPCVVGHDWDYDQQEVSRWQADIDLCEMIYTFTGGNAMFRRNIYWLAVMLFGWWCWRKDYNIALYTASMLRKNTSANFPIDKRRKICY